MIIASLMLVDDLINLALCWSCYYFLAPSDDHEHYDNEEEKIIDETRIL